MTIRLLWREIFLISSVKRTKHHDFTSTHHETVDWIFRKVLFSNTSKNYKKTHAVVFLQTEIVVIRSAPQLFNKGLLGINGVWQHLIQKVGNALLGAICAVEVIASRWCTLAHFCNMSLHVIYHLSWHTYLIYICHGDLSICLQYRFKCAICFGTESFLKQSHLEVVCFTDVFSSFKVGGDLGIVRLIVLRALLQEVRCYLATGNDGSRKMDEHPAQTSDVWGDLRLTHRYFFNARLQVAIRKKLYGKASPNLGSKWTFLWKLSCVKSSIMVHC